MGVKIREKVKDSGVYWIFVNHNGKRTSRQVGSLKAAEEAKTKIEARLTLGQWAPKEKAAAPTLAEYYKRFTRVYLETSVREGTKERYECSYKHILPELGAFPLDQITRERIKDFIATLVAKRYETRIKVKTYANPLKKRQPIIEWKTIERPLAKTTIRIILNELCSLFSHAVEENVIAVNPALKLGKFYKQAKSVHDEIQPLTAEEVEVFLGTVRQFSTEHFPLFLTALHTGMREGELAGLQWSDVDFHGKFFLLRRQLNRGRIQPTKTAKPRRVDMSDAVASELLALKKKRQTEYFARGENEIPEWIFMSRGRLMKEGKRGESKRIDMHNVKTRHFYKCLERAGLRRIRFHDLRHTYATLLLMQGESPVYVKEQLGHSSIKVTVDIYGHWIPGANREAVNRLPSLKAAAQSAG